MWEIVNMIGFWSVTSQSHAAKIAFLIRQTNNVIVMKRLASLDVSEM